MLKKFSDFISETRDPHKVVSDKLKDINSLKKFSYPTPAERKAELEKQKKPVKEEVDELDELDESRFTSNSTNDYGSRGVPYEFKKNETSKLANHHDVLHNGQHIGSIHSYTSHKDTKAAGNKYVTSRKEVTRWSATVNKGHHRMSWGVGASDRSVKDSAHTDMELKSKKDALQRVADIHRSHLDHLKESEEMNLEEKENQEHQYVMQSLADKDINAHIKDGKVVVHKDNAPKAKSHLKKIGHGDLSVVHEGFEELEESIKIGDHVHVGHMVKGGAGVKGKVKKIDGESIHIEEIGSTSKFGPKSWKGKLSNTTKINESEEQLDEIIGHKKPGEKSFRIKSKYKNFPERAHTIHSDSRENAIKFHQKHLGGSITDIKHLDENEELDEMTGHTTKSLSRELKKMGWGLHNTSGGHDVYKHPKSKINLAVPRHAGELSRPTTTKILKQAKQLEGTAMLSFKDYLKEETMDRVKDAHGTMVRVHAPGYANHGKKGEIIDSDRDGSFHVVQFKNGKSASYHGSDLKRLKESEELDEEVEVLEEGRKEVSKAKYDKIAAQHKAGTDGHLPPRFFKNAQHVYSLEGGGTGINTYSHENYTLHSITRHEKKGHPTKYFIHDLEA